MRGKQVRGNVRVRDRVLLPRRVVERRVPPRDPVALVAGRRAPDPRGAAVEEPEPPRPAQRQRDGERVRPAHHAACPHTHTHTEGERERGPHIHAHTETRLQGG